MLTAATGKDNAKNYERYSRLTELTDGMLCRAKDIFEEYRAQGVILCDNFGDDEWLITNQVRKTTLRFLPNEFLFKRHAENWLGCSYRCYVDGIKAYAIFNMGGFTIRSLREIVNVLVRAAEKPCEELTADAQLTEFLKLLPGGEVKDRVIEDMEEQQYFQSQQKTHKNQRILADFTSYFAFNNALENFWSNSDEKDRLFFFPLYFWWNLTAILPLRPTEFLLTPRKCLETKNGEAVLTIRRTTLKGRQSKVKHNINDDYELVKYSVTEKIAEEISKYIRTTDSFPLSALNTLFVPEAHYFLLGRISPPTSVYYSYQNLSHCLRKFQDDIMKINSDKDRVNLGDTRHLAMINLIVSGGSPVICKELAGHEDINISSHYYTNISKFIECATYEMYQKSKYGAFADIQNHRLFSKSKTVAVNSGRCDSAVYISGSINDCIRSIGANGELGNCVSCPHFIDGRTGKHFMFSDSNINAQKIQVDEDSKYLIRLLEAVRKGRGCNEDIQSALLRLQQSSSGYSQNLYRKMGGL
jgi:hypothetical protein